MSTRFAIGTRSALPAGAEPFTTWGSDVDVAAVYLALPAYCAVIECVPADNDALEQVAWLDTSGTLLQSVVAPSVKVTAPSASPLLPVTVAVNVTAWPPLPGLSGEVSAMVGATGRPETNCR